MSHYYVFQLVQLCRVAGFTNKPVASYLCVVRFIWSLGQRFPPIYG